MAALQGRAHRRYINSPATVGGFLNLGTVRSFRVVGAAYSAIDAAITEWRSAAKPT